MLYDYKCHNCEHEMVDVYQSIKDDAFTLCPACGKNDLGRVIYGGIHSTVRSVNTIGQMADKNWKSMGSYKQSEILEKSKQNQKQSPFQEFGSATKKQINKMNSEQKKKYIITGEL